MEFALVKNNAAAAFVVEKETSWGVGSIAGKVCRDVSDVTGILPQVKDAGDAAEDEPQVIFGIIGESRTLAELERSGAIDCTAVRGKRECFLFRVVSPQKLVIAGSDKRGTIYGLFHISECIGVSPWVRFADVVPAKKREVVFSERDTVCSREPSVKYRGFFINDEWPAFGNWTFSRYGGFTAEMYDLIFETLLRLKGNYLWPAMWTSSFSLDGPGEESAKLADAYGIIMSNSHHEPCLRHSEEWDIVRGEDSVYGNAWNYAENKEGLLRYWRDGLLRSGKYENIITIGMRGERDSLMLGEDATLAENIAQLKEIITEQRRLIAKCVGENAPQMLALYKEVEAYYYGDEQTAGLKDWDGLRGVTLMLCEDNFGNMRTLPQEEKRECDGGFGMYYHFDYHGCPVSYEWVNSSYLPKVWDQMTMAYDFGVRDIWIVNVGDLKFQEYPLSFFMDLAYDYERWGSGRKDAPAAYLKHWTAREFGGYLSEELQNKTVEVMKGYTKMNHNCKPEVMRPDTYHPLHFSEGKRRLAENDRLKELLWELKEQIPYELLAAYWELVYYPAMGSVNVSDMQLYAGLNHFYARMGAVMANDYADKVRQCIAADRELTEDMHRLLDGKWNGMGLSEHIGFANWNDEECRYPVIMYVEPANKPQLMAYEEGDDTATAGGDWTGKLLVMRAFHRAGVTEGRLILQNTCKEDVAYTILCSIPGVTVVPACGTVHREETLSVDVQKELLPAGAEFTVHYAGGNIRVCIEADYAVLPKCAPMTFFEEDGLLSIEASHFAECVPGNKGAFAVLEGYGKTLAGVKAYPQTKTYFSGDGTDGVPYLVYRMWVKEAGEYDARFYTAPANPVRERGDVSFGYAVNDGEVKKVSLIPDGYRAGEPSCAPWAKMVCAQIRVTAEKITLQKGENRISIYAGTPGFILEKIVLVRAGKTLPVSYLGPQESYYIS